MMAVLKRCWCWLISPAVHEERATHAVWLAVALLFVLAPFALRPGISAGDGVRLGSHELPGVCASKRLFDVKCPACGMTRAMVLAAHGRFRDSLAAHRAGLPLYAFLAWQVVVRAVGIWKPLRLVAGVEAAAQRVAPMLIIGLLLVGWLLDLVAVL